MPQFSVRRYSRRMLLNFLFQKQNMGNQVVMCGKEKTLTENLRVVSLAQTTEDLFETRSIDQKCQDPLKQFLKKPPPPKIKTLNDISGLSKTSLTQLEETLISRVKLKSTQNFKTYKTITTREMRGVLSSTEQSIDYDSNMLLMVEEQIEKLIQEDESHNNGSKNLRESIDRSQLFKRLNINLASFIRTTGANVKDYYDFRECIGQGSYGKVFRAICKQSKQQRAIKILKRKEGGGRQRQKSFFLAEFDLLSTLDHPNIIKLFQIFYFKGHYYVVMQYCNGGSLLDLLTKKKTCSQQMMVPIMKQLLSALAYLHSKNIVHRDIKLENIVVLKKVEKDLSIKIIDFGTAVKITSRGHSKVAGTRTYMAPEVFKGQLNVKSDIWACGVFLYIMFTSKFPFSGSTLYEMEKAVNHQLVSFAGKEAAFISMEAKKLILGMMEKNTEKRLSAVEALNHPWFVKAAHSEIKVTYEESNLSMLEKYHRGNNFMAVIENYLSLRQISQEQRDRLGKLFRQIDINNDGVIQYEELVKIWQENNVGSPESQVKKIVQEIDHNNSGKIDFNQFLVAMYSRKKLFLESSLIQAFKFYDTDQDGFLQRAQVIQLLQGCETEEVEYLMKEVDVDKDEKISLSEFLNYMIKAGDVY